MYNIKLNDTVVKESDSLDDICIELNLLLSKFITDDSIYNIVDVGDDIVLNMDKNIIRMSNIPKFIFNTIIYF
jgi:hypothetical protein